MIQLSLLHCPVILFDEVNISIMIFFHTFKSTTIPQSVKSRSYLFQLSY